MHVASDIYIYIYIWDNVQVLKRKKRKGNVVKANLSNRGDSYLLITCKITLNKIEIKLEKLKSMFMFGRILTQK
jgi:hypothetical protein